MLASEIAEATREVAIPKAKTAAAAGAASAAGLAASGKELAAAKVAEVKGEPQKPKRGKLRKLLIFGSLAAAAGFVYNKLRGSQRRPTTGSRRTRRPPRTHQLDHERHSAERRHGRDAPRARRRPRRADRHGRPDGPAGRRAGRGR